MQGKFTHIILGHLFAIIVRGESLVRPLTPKLTAQNTAHKFGGAGAKILFFVLEQFFKLDVQPIEDAEPLSDGDIYHLVHQAALVDENGGQSLKHQASQGLVNQVRAKFAIRTELVFFFSFLSPPPTNPAEVCLIVLSMSVVSSQFRLKTLRDKSALCIPDMYKRVHAHVPQRNFAGLLTCK